jgi:hypothetical protein
MIGGQGVGLGNEGWIALLAVVICPSLKCNFNALLRSTAPGVMQALNQLGVAVDITGWAT